MAITLTLTHRVTDEELLELSERNPGYQFERTAKGELIVTPTSGRSAHRETELGRQLGNWAQQNRRGVVFSPTAGFKLPDGSFFLPDAAWVRRDRWDALDPEQQDEILSICPDAAFEIRAKTSRPADLQDKMRAYLANGAQIAILIDPYERTVEVYQPGREPETHRDPTTVTLDPGLPGFVLDLEPIFAV
jgi:Uma2 family endonuclease